MMKAIKVEPSEVTIVGYANGAGGIMFVGVSNNGEAFGISLDEIDKIKNLPVSFNVIGRAGAYI